MDYFPKWTEVVALKNMTQRINPLYSIADHTQIRHSSSMSHQVCEFAESLKIKLLSSSPYYAQANGQIESSNMTLTKLIKKKIEEHPKRWHEVLSEALWAHHISKQSATKVTPFQLVYGQEAILLLEVNLDAL
jgi:hypothetical protein